jgi:hypothetical protein
MYDGAEILEQKGQVLEFYQTFSGATVSFKAFSRDVSMSLISVGGLRRMCLGVLTLYKLIKAPKGL